MTICGFGPGLMRSRARTPLRTRAFGLMKSAGRRRRRTPRSSLPATLLGQVRSSNPFVSSLPQEKYNFSHLLK